MTKKEFFIKLIKKHILPLLYISEKTECLSDIEISTLSCSLKRDANHKNNKVVCPINDVTYKKDGKIEIKCNIVVFYISSDCEQIVFKSNGLIQKKEISMVTEIMKEFIKVQSKFIPAVEGVSYNIIKYAEAVYAAAVGMRIFQWLGNINYYSIFCLLKNWSKRYYENRRVPFAFLIDCSDNKNIKSKESTFDDEIKILQEKYFAVFTDGIFSHIEINNLGQVKNYGSTLLDIDKTQDALQKLDTEGNNSKENQHCKEKHLPYSPQVYANFCKRCDNKLGMILQGNGNILIIRNKQIMFAYIEGVWHRFSYYGVEKYLKSSINNTTKNELNRQLLLTLLDVSFAHTGGCISILDENQIDALKGTNIKKKDFIDVDNDNLSDEEITRKEFLMRLIGKEKFQNISRKLRQELLAMDGACVIDKEGNIRVVGAIIKAESGSEEGARAAAAKSLSKDGFAVKISMDGKISFYIDGKKDCELF